MNRIIRLKCLVILVFDNANLRLAICRKFKMALQKKFSKLKFLQSVGLLDAKFNYDRLCFERCRFMRLKSKLILFANLTKLLELFISPLFEREDLIQLYIGSVYNSYTGTARCFMAWVVSISSEYYLLANQLLVQFIT